MTDQAIAPTARGQDTPNTIQPMKAVYETTMRERNRNERIAVIGNKVKITRKRFPQLCCRNRATTLPLLYAAFLRHCKYTRKPKTYDKE